MKFSMFILLCMNFAFAGPIGSYSNGRLENGVSIPAEGNGYIQIFLENRHNFGTQGLINMVLKTASEMNARYPNRDRLQIEEMSAEFGGDIEPHGSHENGLDVDVGYYKVDGVEHDPRKSKDYYAPSMVVNGQVSPNFDVERNWEMVKSFHKHANVSKIFMDQILKNKLCQYAKSKNELVSGTQVLRSIRHVENHQDHLHVRLHCPVGAKGCIGEKAPAAGSGCR